MNAIGVAILVFIVIAVLSAPRRWAVLAMMAGVLYLTEAQMLNLAGFHLFAFRFVELAAFIRVVGRHEFLFSKLNLIDKALLLLFAYSTTVFLLRSNEEQAYQIGVGLDAYLCYFTFRGLLGGIDDIRWFLRKFLLLLGPYVALLLVERLTNQNLFTSLLGGTALDDSWLRNGHIRCLGSFRHPSLLGTLGASFLPLYIGMVLTKADRKLAAIGIGLCLAIVWASNSGAPASCVIVGILGWLLWRFRNRMQWFRRGMVVGIVLLAMAMKMPVWYLLDRVSSVTGGDGWHRSYLLDMAYQHLGNWWLAGMPLQGTADWFPYVLPDYGVADITNQFIAFGLTGGLGAMALFIVLLTLAFSKLGRAAAALRSLQEPARETELLYWGMGVMLAVHVSNWLGITYFDQFSAIWFMQLAAISNLSESCLQNVAIGERHQAFPEKVGIPDEHALI